LHEIDPEQIENEIKEQDQNENLTGLFVIKEANKSIDGISRGTNVPACRICLEDTNELLNPLFTPCKCSGTMKFIHL